LRSENHLIVFVYKTICDARFHMDKDYEMILTTQYRKRDKQSVEEPTE
jgi:hypothetical protein